MPVKKKILVTGASGFLGSNFCALYAGQFDIYGLWNQHPLEMEGINAVKADITDKESLALIFQDIQTDVVIHLAALSDPNFCELNPDASERINIEASETIAGLCRDMGAKLVFASTDLVFDGKSAPYMETDLPCPINIYGIHKSIAEQSMLDIYPDTIICRLPLMYGPAPTISGSADNGKGAKSASQIIETRKNTSFLQPMLKKLEAEEQVSLFTDEYRTVASARDVCAAMLLCLEHPGEIFHLGGDERVSRYEFAQKVCRVFGFNPSLLIKGKQREVTMPARRPKDVSLSNKKIKKLGWMPRNIEQELTAIKEQNS